MTDTKTLFIVSGGTVVDACLVPSAAAVAGDGSSATWGDTTIQAPSGATYVDQDEAGIGWVMKGDVLVAPPPPAAPTPPAGNLLAYAAAKRFAVETGGITVNGAQIATDRVSQAMVGNAYAYVQASGAASVSYKALGGFVTLTAAQVKAVALAVGAHVQAAFAAEAEADAGISASPPTITTEAQVDALFVGL